MENRFGNLVGRVLTSKEGPNVGATVEADEPQHVAVIMDGNGRWAKRQGLPRVAGHREGTKSLKSIVKVCPEMGIKYLTVFAFSTENWRRPATEVSFLMNLLQEVLEREVDELHANGVRLNVIGRWKELPVNLRTQVERALAKTAGNDGLVLTLALNYGGRAEIVDAAKRLAQDLKDRSMDLESIDEASFPMYLNTVGLPDPDLLIRTSGEYRVSNFLLWQIAYAELWVTDVLWPDFREEHFIQAIMDYRKRERRFGRVHYR